MGEKAKALTGVGSPCNGQKKNHKRQKKLVEGDGTFAKKNNPDESELRGG